MKITSRGQVTIPAEIRKRLGLLPHTEVCFEMDGDAVRLLKADPAKPDREHSFVEHHHSPPKITTMAMDEMVRLSRGED